MGKLIDLTGQRFGSLIVQKRDKSRKSDTYWLCQCDCGKITSVLGKNLKSGRTKSCGCNIGQNISKKLRKNLIGKKFGRLTVLCCDEVKTAEQKRTYWLCQCECGNIKSIYGANLKNQKVHSCGCYNLEQIRKRSLKDLTGQKFGKLTVLNYDEELSTEKKHSYWKCQCECGNIKSILSSSLIEKNTTSCGCLKYSIGEINIISILQKNKIDFIKEYAIQELGLLRYDFYLPEYNRLIEFDGIQHFENNQKSKWNQNGKFEQRLLNDKIKNNYAISHNIDLIRIPYWERDNITLEMLLGDQYKIKEV